jgi:hypothetical protein
LAGGFATGGGFWSPSVVFSGQIENAGHFLQPTAMATGHSTMISLLEVS